MTDLTLIDLQTHLKQTCRYGGAIDGKWGRLTESGILLMMTDGPDTSLVRADFDQSAARLQVPVANILAFAEVEAAGAGFQAGVPKILPERHRFSKNTNRRFDASHPTLSYPKWGTLPYPGKQDARYDMLLKMIRLDVDAGFASASYGKFQIMGENHLACGYANSMLFAEAMARDEKTQLQAFEGFIRNNGLLPALRAMGNTPASCEAIARGYNGTGFRQHNYHGRLADARRKYL